MLSFVIAEEDLRIEKSYSFNEVTAVFLLNNPRYHCGLYLLIRQKVFETHTAGSSWTQHYL